MLHKCRHRERETKRQTKAQREENENGTSIQLAQLFNFHCSTFTHLDLLNSKRKKYTRNNPHEIYQSST